MSTCSSCKSHKFEKSQRQTVDQCGNRHWLTVRLRAPQIGVWISGARSWHTLLTWWTSSVSCSAMFCLLASQYAVYEDTVRQTPGRPEMMANYQALWLLPKVPPSSMFLEQFDSP